MAEICMCGGKTDVSKNYTEYDGRIMDLWFSVSCRSCGLTIGKSEREFRTPDEAMASRDNASKKIELNLSKENEVLKNFARLVAYPNRGQEEHLGLQDIADMIQKVYTLDQLKSNS